MLFCGRIKNKFNKVSRKKDWQSQTHLLQIFAVNAEWANKVAKKTGEEKINTFFFVGCFAVKKSAQRNIQPFGPPELLAVHYAQTTFDDNTHTQAFRTHLPTLLSLIRSWALLFIFISVCIWSSFALIAACDIRLNFYGQSIGQAYASLAQQIYFICVCSKCTLGFGIYFNIVNLGII